MKNKKTYLSLFFLSCFILSFSISTAQNFNAKTNKACFTSEKTASFNHSDKSTKTSGDFLFEENENETENDFQLPAFLLPFFISYFQFQVEKPQLVSANSLAEKETNPIYIAVCNFRI